ncbi:hypothetical protein ACFXKF_36430 [Streptomyces scopuliridis]|uniref:hypothetical protein n=1 Tax=Streptomyces scopuliridis TaxID=452529 RepID=UPI00369C7817
MQQEPSHPRPLFAVTFHDAMSVGHPARFTSVEDVESLASALNITAPPSDPVLTYADDGRTPWYSVVPLNLDWRTMTSAEAEAAAGALNGTHWLHSEPGPFSRHQYESPGLAIGGVIRSGTAMGNRVAVTPHVVGLASESGDETCLFLARHAPAAWARGEHAPLVAEADKVASVLTRVGFLPDTDGPGHFNVSEGARPGTVRLTATGESWFSESAAMVDTLHRDDYTAEETRYADVLTVRVATQSETAARREATARTLMP